MKLVESTWHKLYTVGIRVFLLFVAMSLPFLFLGLFVIKTKDNWGYLLTFILLINGVVWLLLALLGLVKYRIISNKLAQLRIYGNSYEVTIKRMVPLWYLRLGGYVMAAVEGYYTDAHGNTQSVKSTNYVFTTFDKTDDFEAKIHLDAGDPQSYSVELFRKE